MEVVFVRYPGDETYAAGILGDRYQDGYWVTFNYRKEDARQVHNDYITKIDYWVHDAETSEIDTLLGKFADGPVKALMSHLADKLKNTVPAY